jgi:predicted hydrolase (HD superfamily)
MAAPAIVIDRTELNQQAMIATDDFPRIYRGKSRSHRVVGVPEPATPYYSRRYYVRGVTSAAETICGTSPVDVKVKMHRAANFAGENRNEAAKSRRDRAKGMIDREAAWCLLTEFTQSESLRKHAQAVEACMRACARKFGPGNSEASALGMSEEDLWGIVGLIHDFDYEKYPSLEDHPYRGNEILKERGWPEVIRRAIMSHAEYTGVTRDTPMEKALFACDELAGFITAVALIKPGKSLAEVDTKSVRKRMKDKAFARKVNRDDIVNGAAGLGVDLDEHIAFCIEGLRGIAGVLGLDGSAAKAV